METAEVLQLLREVAADVIDPRFRALESSQVHEKRPGDLVTIADHEAEELITAALSAAYPDALVLGEEACAQDPGLLDRYAEAAHAFTVDPVDGTKNFVRGSPDHAVMVSEVRAGIVERAWIWQPQHRSAFVAERGAGAWHNDEPLHSPPRAADAAQWRGVTSRRPWLQRRLQPALQALELTWVSCGIDYPHVTTGAADYALYARCLPWDHAPGSLITTEAGGVVATMSGEAYDPRRVQDGLLVAGSAAVADVLLPLLPPDPR